MASVLETISRTLIRGLLAVFTIVVLFLVQSIFWTNAVSSWMRIIVVAVALIAYFRPQNGLLVLAALTPLGQVGSRTLNSQMRGAEALVLAFLAGALVRGWTLREFRSFPSTRLETAALIFGLVVAASCAEQLWLTQIQRDFAWPVAQDFFAYASREYLASFRGFEMLFRTMLLLEGMALLIYAARYGATSVGFTRRLVMMLVLGAMATAMLTFEAAAAEFAQTHKPVTSVIDFFARGRWIGHIADLNAGGSYFAMMSFLTAGIGFMERERRSAWFASGAVLFLTMFMTGSRTAVAAAGFVGVFIFVRVALSHSSYPLRALGAAGALFAAGTAAFLVHRTTGATPSVAVSVRWAFLETTARMLSAEPAFGVGIGQFSFWSAHFAPPALFRLWRPDNAHNNLAQIAGELGLVGLTTLLMVLATSFRIRPDTLSVNPLRAPLIASLAAFLLTWLGGHPLLVPEVAYPFWIALGGVAAAPAPDAAPRGTTGITIMVIFGILILSVPFRVHSKAISAGLTMWDTQLNNPTPIQP